MTVRRTWEQERASCGSRHCDLPHEPCPTWCIQKHSIHNDAHQGERVELIATWPFPRYGPVLQLNANGDKETTLWVALPESRCYLDLDGAEVYANTLLDMVRIGRKC
jgi:hypothetical protein